MSKYATRFNKVMASVAEPAPAYICYSAILRLGGEEYLLAAPDVQGLRMLWVKAAGEELVLDESRIQRVALMSQVHLTLTSNSCSPEKP